MNDGTTICNDVEASRHPTTASKKRGTAWRPSRRERMNDGATRSGTAGEATTTGSSIARVSTGRLLFLTCLLGVALGLGFAAHRFLTNAERELGSHQFGSLAERALSSAKATAERKLMGGITLAAITAGMNPTAAGWPNITFPNFEEIVRDLVKTSGGGGFGVGAIVRPEQVPGFEYFALRAYRNSGEWAEGTGNSSFGFGIRNVDVREEDHGPLHIGL